MAVQSVTPEIILVVGGAAAAKAWTRWLRLEGIAELRQILWRSWDPLGLRGHAPDDEYDDYARVVASKLRRGGSAHEIADYLATTLSEGAVVTDAWLEKCRSTANELITWYAASSAPD